MNERIIDMVGQKFGYWIVVSMSDRKGKSIYWNCVCVCGKQMVVEGCRLRRGASKSCRCKSQEFRLQKRMTHGETVGRKATKEYRAWQAIINRCRKPTSTKFYHRYGGRGIDICERWFESYENFIEDIGRAPTEKHSIDRIDNTGNYCKENCRWATTKEQSRNKRTNVLVEYKGVVKVLSDWVSELNINRSVISRYLKKGKTLEWVCEKYKNKT